MSSSMMAEVRNTGEVETQLALAGFLAGYSGNTRLAYQQDLRAFLTGINTALPVSTVDELSRPAAGWARRGYDASAKGARCVRF
jgi:hypothetical protein